MLFAADNEQARRREVMDLLGTAVVLVGLIGLGACKKRPTSFSETVLAGLNPEYSPRHLERGAKYAWVINLPLLQTVAKIKENLGEPNSESWQALPEEYAFVYSSKSSGLRFKVKDFYFREIHHPRGNHFQGPQNTVSLVLAYE